MGLGVGGALHHLWPGGHPPGHGLGQTSLNRTALVFWLLLLANAISAGNRRGIVKEIVVNEMQNVVHLTVPLIADCGVGTNWLQAH